jgi:hypothetical protein
MKKSKVGGRAAATPDPVAASTLVLEVASIPVLEEARPQDQAVGSIEVRAAVSIQVRAADFTVDQAADCIPVLGEGCTPAQEAASMQVRAAVSIQVRAEASTAGQAAIDEIFLRYPISFKNYEIAASINSPTKLRGRIGSICDARHARQVSTMEGSLCPNFLVM